LIGCGKISNVDIREEEFVGKQLSSSNRSEVTCLKKPLFPIAEKPALPKITMYFQSISSFNYELVNHYDFWKWLINLNTFTFTKIQIHLTILLLNQMAYSIAVN